MRGRGQALRLLALVSAGLGSVGAYAQPEGSATLGAWQDYALSAITPEFGWAEQKPAVAPTALSLALEGNSASRIPSFQLIPSAEQLKLSVSFGNDIVGDLPNAGQGVSVLGPTLLGAGLERNYFSPALTQRIGDDTTISAAAVFVYQKFASWGMGAGVNTQQLNAGPPISTTFREESTGSGGRLQLNSAMADGVDLVTSFQTRVNMNEFQNYRGVFSDPGDFDVPAVAGLGLLWNGDQRFQVGFGVSRVMWSDVTTFSSASLPRSVLRLLGDGNSPSFAWQDLTVYDLDLGWRATKKDTFALTVTTHQQPEPTSALLRRALSDSASDADVGVRYLRDFGSAGRLTLGASYAPIEYFLSNYSYSDHNLTGNQIEMEAVWSMDF